MTTKTPGEHAVTIHKMVADLNCLMATAAGDGLRVDLDVQRIQTVRGGYSTINVKLYQRITP
jgi:hypothetical protein